jgi:hypothetical protein
MLVATMSFGRRVHRYTYADDVALELYRASAIR